MKTLSCLALLAVSAFAFSKTPQPQKSGIHEIGRYQFQATDKNLNYMIDTKTGRVWMSYSGNAWKQAHGPVTGKMMAK